MTEEEIEQKAQEIRDFHSERVKFCNDVGITLDNFFIKWNGDFEIEDMVRAFERGKQSRDCNCMTYLNFKDLEKENAELKERADKADLDSVLFFNQLCKAKEIIKTILGFMQTFGYSPSMDKFITETEQFLNSEVEK